jgi:hypothetical protein
VIWHQICEALAFIERQPRPADVMVDRLIEVSVADDGVADETGLN